MTAIARKILSDLQVAQDLLQTEQSSERFRVLWVSSVALCRAIGHALQKVDAKSSTKTKAAVSAAYAAWKEDPEKNHIFSEFIENERNSVLKEYEFGFLSGAGTLDGLVLPDGLFTTIADNFFCPMTGGRFSGVDCRDVLDAALRWWQKQLELIDQAVAT